MRTHRHVVALSLAVVAIAGCRGKPSPWARKLTQDEARAWPTRCGIPLEAIRSSEGKGTDDVYEGTWDNPNGPAGAIRIDCTVFWLREKRRPAAFHGRVTVATGRPQVALSEAEIRQVADAIAAELPSSEQGAIRDATRREAQTTDHGAFTYAGGYADNGRLWSLTVTLR